MEVLRLAGLDLGLIVAGEAILVGLGLVRTRRMALRYAGLSLIVGWAMTGVCASLAVEAQLPLTVATVVCLWVLIVGVSAVVMRRVPAWEGAVAVRETSHRGRVASLLGGALLAGVLFTLLRRALASGPLQPDVWNFWLPRAKILFETGKLDTGVGGFTSFTHAEYPPLVPVSDGTVFHFMGQEDVLLLPLQHWLLFLGFLGAGWGLLAHRVRPAILLPSLAGIAMLPMVDKLVGSSLADEPLAELFALAGVAAALWLLEREWRFAAVCGILLAALPMMKNEGLMLGLALLIVLAAATNFRPRRTLIALVAVVVLAAVPWQVWHAANGAPSQSDYQLGDIARIGWLADRVDRLGIALRGLTEIILDPGRWLLTVPLVLLLAVVLRKSRPGLAAFAAGTIALTFAAYLGIYWIGRLEIHFYLDSAGERVTAPIALFAAFLFPLLLAEAAAEAAEPHSADEVSATRTAAGSP